MQIFSSCVFAYCFFLQVNLTTPGTYRHSGGFEQEVIYLTSRIGVTRGVHKEGDGQIRIYYTLGKVEYINPPELSTLTGDAMREPLVSSISEMLWDAKRQIFAGYGFYAKDNQSSKPGWFIMNCNTEKISFYESEASFQSAISKLSLSDVKLVPSEWYFRRMVHDFGKDATDK